MDLSNARTNYILQLGSALLVVHSEVPSTGNSPHSLETERIVLNEDAVYYAKINFVDDISDARVLTD